MIPFFLLQISSSKLRKYSKEWNAREAQQKMKESTGVTLQRQIDDLLSQVKRLERENEALASGLLGSKANLHKQIDKVI